MFFRRQEVRRSTSHKDLQLAAQVATIVGAALAELDDPVLGQLLVVDATPAPDAGRLAVTVCLPRSARARAGAATAPTIDDVLARLGRVKGHLRAEVAAGITRKRAPELAFVVVPAEEDGP
ncbi:MAG: ribosome-binding factor A [Myxococcales bacterium]|nr:ribosome-binding factor A [Myxococcales bacterium]